MTHKNKKNTKLKTFYRADY